MNDLEVLKMLFEEHHRQLSVRRQKIHTTSERTLALLIFVAGWLVINDKPLTEGVHWIIAIAVAFIAFGSCSIIYHNNNIYYEIAKVVIKISNALGLFESNKFGLNEPMYPDSWNWTKFGEKGKFWGAFTHYCMVVAAAVFCIIASFLRAQ